ncbi:MAG: dihydropteroate synthase [Lentisphaerae bacterium]|jgi:dihydropteroate synthase|nr:dihydropteroate synthase [Lentisphaerota bacterium]MBT4820576.1 dihydropteroate synthase [Lentisphaerota bacterium]MBT5611491.1 dihydropteroate synthase [Lentisphaerota bacterium]MBT7056353.1 dihydropteroate synthase [Lentisphaerota bacterium]MBT7842971.1 dihydropteroate synthase [Lentisphaerota bacterium]
MQNLDFCFADMTWHLGSAPLIMGILNVTPDSFSDGGDYASTDRAIGRALAMVEQGAAVIDVGGESTRPGSMAVDAPEEIRRVVPVIEELSRQTTTPISIDTAKAPVAKAAIEAGAAIVNDVSGLHADPDMAGVVAKGGAGCVIMHMRGTPETMQQFTHYDDLCGQISTYFRETIAYAESEGVPPTRIMLDSGIGFSKTAEQNLTLIAETGRFRQLGRPVLVGPSRKSFIGTLLDGTPPKERVWGTAGAVAAAIIYGADVLRVHDVEEMRQVAVVASAIRNAAASD